MKRRLRKKLHTGEFTKYGQRFSLEFYDLRHRMEFVRDLHSEVSRLGCTYVGDFGFLNCEFVVEFGMKNLVWKKSCFAYWLEKQEMENLCLSDLFNLYSEIQV